MQLLQLLSSHTSIQCHALIRATNLDHHITRPGPPDSLELFTRLLRSQNGRLLNPLNPLAAILLKNPLPITGVSILQPMTDTAHELSTHQTSLEIAETLFSLHAATPRALSQLYCYPITFALQHLTILEVSSYPLAKNYKLIL